MGFLNSFNSFQTMMLVIHCTTATLFIERTGFICCIYGRTSRPRDLVGQDVSHKVPTSTYLHVSRTTQNTPGHHTRGVKDSGRGTVLSFQSSNCIEHVYLRTSWLICLLSVSLVNLSVQPIIAMIHQGSDEEEYPALRMISYPLQEWNQAQMYDQNLRELRLAHNVTFH
jgi:hypothetical protein